MKANFCIPVLVVLALPPLIAGDLPVEIDSKQGAADFPSIPASTSSPWEFEASPYFWFANLKGTVGVAGINSNIDIGIDDIFDNLDFAFATSGGVRYEGIGLFADFMYLKVTPSFETPGPAFGRTDLVLEQTVLDLKGSYRVIDSDRGWLDVLAGARYQNIDMNLTLQPGLAPMQSGTDGSEWWDAVGGLRGQYNLTDRVFLTAMADVGGGSSEITWQALGGVGFQLNELVHLTAGYRYMDYDYEDGDFKFDVATRGAYVELGFSW